MANTTNLNLVKPAGTDKALVSVLNSNSDKIDAFAGTTNQALSTKTPYEVLSSGSLLDYVSGMAVGTKIIHVSNSAVTDRPVAVRGIAIAEKTGNDEMTVQYNAVNGNSYVNNRYGGAWTGWKELALKSVSTPSITKGSTITGSSYVNARECANVVTIAADVTTNTASSGYTTIATCEKHPHTNEYIAWIDTQGNTKMGRLTTGGELQIHNPANSTNYMVTITFVATN